MDLDHRLESMREEMTASLQRLIAFRSVEAPAEEGKPFGPEVDACLESCLALCESLGFPTVNVDHMLGYCEYGEGDEMIAVLGHLDVVPEGDGWSVPPYAGEIRDGRLYGRGAIDDKGPTIAALYALKALRDSGVPLSRRIRILFGLNEETGSADMKYYLEHGGEVPVMGFTPDGEYPIINGEKGIVNLVYEKSFRTPGAINLREISGGIAGNVVPEAAYAVLDCSSEDAARLTARLEGLEKITAVPVEGGLRIEAVGKNAHGSTPWLGENAIGRLLLALQTLDLGGDAGETIAFLADRIGMDARGERMGILLEDELSGTSTFNLGVLRGGADGILIRLNVRYPVTCSYDDFIPPLEEQMTAHGFVRTFHQHKAALYMPPESPLVRTLAQVYEEKTGQPAFLKSIGGGTYAKCIPNLVAFGPIFPGDEVCEHKPDEYIEIDKLVRNAQIYAAALYALAK